MLQVKGLSVSYGERQIFRNLSFVINDGEKIGLVGNNGTGKTTIFKVLAGELQPDSGQIISPKSNKICYVPQHLTMDSFNIKEDVLTFMLEGRGLFRINKRLSEIENQFENSNKAGLNDLLDEFEHLQEMYLENEGYKAEGDILSLLIGVGLSSVSLDQPLSYLSGGQRTKLALARMLFEQSDLLLLDEPTNHIDQGSIDWLSNYLAESSKTILVISHLSSFLNKFTKRILLLEEQPIGHIKSYTGNYSQYLTQRKLEDKSYEKSCIKARSKIKKYENFINNAAQSQVGLKHSREKAVEKLDENITSRIKSKKIKIDFKVKTILKKPALSATGLAKSFANKRIFRDISIELGPNEKIAITGENGAGKTTLLRILSGHLIPDNGEVIRNQKLEIGWYQQDLDNLNESYSILEEIEESGFEKKWLRAALDHFLFPADRLSQRVGTLSRGERARLCLCVLMLDGPNLLLLDEPTNHLDQLSRESLINALIKYKGAMIIVSHDIDFLKRIGISWALEMPHGGLLGID